MDKNSIFGIILIAAILIVWGIVQKPNRTQLGLPSAKDTTEIVSEVQTGTDTVTVEVGEDGLAIVAVPETTDQVPTPALGAFPTNVVVVPQTF